MIYRIAVCEDEPAQAELTARMIRRWGVQTGRPAEPVVYSSAEAFLFAFEEDKDYAVLLLDIQMAGLSGLELANAIRRQGESLPIVFLTALPDYAAQGYNVSALHYLLKPVEEATLFACLNKAVEQADRSPLLLLTACTGEALRIYQRDIQYMEAFSHIAAIHTSCETLEVRAGFGELERRLEPGWFVRCHRSYLVGLRYVARMGKTELTLDSGQMLPVSRRCQPQVSSAFIRYYRREE